MNTNDLGMFLLVMVSGSLGLVLFIIFSNFILNVLKTSSPVRLPRVGTDVEGDLRRKVETNPNIICMLPIHEEKRPEGRLW